MEQAKAREFIEIAKQSGWKEAVAQRYSPSEDGWISLLDWQRASWIPLLELPKESAVLDIGSGYGAITHDRIPWRCRSSSSRSTLPRTPFSPSAGP